MIRKTGVTGIDGRRMLGATCGPFQCDDNLGHVYCACGNAFSGLVTLTATSIADTTKNFSATITVTANPVIVVTIAPTNPASKRELHANFTTSRMIRRTRALLGRFRAQVALVLHAGHFPM